MVQYRSSDDVDARRDEPPGGEPPARSGPDVAALAQAVVDLVGRRSTGGATSALDAVEGAARSLVRRLVSAAIEAPRPVEDRQRLAKALRKRPPSPALGGATAVAFGTKVARRLGPARFAARRTPLWFAVTAVPAVYASITRGAEEVTLVTSHLVLRARAAGIEPDPERLRRVVIQLLTGRDARPDHEASHGPLALAWGRRALRAALPFASTVSTKDPDGLAAAAAAVDPHLLEPRPDAVIDVTERP